MVKAPTLEDEYFQKDILFGVSRTFALTIPQLPPILERAVGNAYLLCRIQDTIEDDPDLSLEIKSDLSRQFVQVIASNGDAQLFSEVLVKNLSAETPRDELKLIESTDKVTRITHDLKSEQKDAITKCVTKMAKGMMMYQGHESSKGLLDQDEMDQYCYFVAGVVGEMLTHIFCDYCPELADKKNHLLQLSVSFGQGLQMTNILKDIWTDKERGVCWLPRKTFQNYNIELSKVMPGQGGTQFELGLKDLLALAAGHLKNALKFTLILPRNQPGIRRFCLWALGMAILTLVKINKNPSFKSGSEVKISRRWVTATIGATSFLSRSNQYLNILFKLGTKSLRVTPVPVPIRSISDLVDSQDT
jgi:farnesyl-diphosphate farnesyltransferase